MDRDEIKWDGWFDAGPGILAGPSAARCWPQKRAALDAASELYLFVLYSMYVVTS
jgi:hypothetical protein